MLPIPVPCKQTLAFAYQYATKNLYGISLRFVYGTFQMDGPNPHPTFRVISLVDMNIIFIFAT